ncbi:MAG: hypothetical protein WA005_12915 [Candidatus Binataceae bacterium]
MPEITANFLADWCEMQRTELVSMGYTLKPSETPEAISLAFYNVQRRVIPLRVRTIFQSRELTCPYKHRAGLNLLLKRAAKGLDLRSHQSKGLLQPDYNDALLNDWRIHHFHLGTTPERDAPDFVQRTGSVLFAYVTADELFAVDVMEHGDWARQRLLEIIHRNWPKLIECYRPKGVLALEMTPSDDDIKKLRSAHVQSATQIDGVVYCAPGGGYAMSGISDEVVDQHDNACRIFSGIQDYMTQNIDTLVKRARQDLGCAMTSPFHFKLKLVGADRVEVIEINSKATFIFPMNSSHDVLDMPVAPVPGYDPRA